MEIPFFLSHNEWKRWSKRKSRLMVDTRRTPAQPLSTVHTHTWAINCPSYIIFYGETLIQCVQPHHGRVREVLRALRGIEAHRRVKVVPANFIGRWANSGSQTAILSSCLFEEKCPIIPRLELKLFPCFSIIVGLRMLVQN